MNKVVLIFALFGLSINADIRENLTKQQKEKNKRMIELVQSYQTDPQWRESNKVFLAHNQNLLSKASELLPELKEATDPWAILWKNQMKLRQNAELNSIFEKHYVLLKERDNYISQRDNQYKEICLKIEQLRKDLRESHKKSI